MSYTPVIRKAKSYLSAEKFTIVKGRLKTPGGCYIAKYAYPRKDGRYNVLITEHDKEALGETNPQLLIFRDSDVDRPFEIVPLLVAVDVIFNQQYPKLVFSLPKMARIVINLESPEYARLVKAKGGESWADLLYLGAGLTPPEPKEEKRDEENQ